MFTPDQLERYSRHFVLKEIGVSGQKKLIASSVLVIGAGALGSSALMYLAAAGVGTIAVVDFDTVDLSNLQRQIIHKTSSVGISKLESAKRTILDINPDVNVVLYNERFTVDNAEQILKPYDFVLDCTDRFETKFLINDACVLYNKPFSHAGIVRFEGQTMTYVPGEGPCLRCVLGGVPPTEKNISCSRAGVLGAAVGVLSSIQATEAIKYILGVGDLLVGRMIIFDGLHMTFNEAKFPSEMTGCAVCGKNSSIKSLEDNRAEYEIKGCGS